jgi:hypothetical protein
LKFALRASRALANVEYERTLEIYNSGLISVQKFSFPARKPMERILNRHTRAATRLEPIEEIDGKRLSNTSYAKNQ